MIDGAILITGCSSGIGLAAASHLHSAGCRVVASARSQVDVSRLKAMGLEAVQMDLADQHALPAQVERALAVAGGRFFAVFHNAGYGQSGALEDLPAQALVEQFQANVFGAHTINTMVLKGMREAGQGRIIFNSSVLGFMAMKYRGAYNASKFALEGMADTLRLELKGSGIHVSLIQPGPITTNFRMNSLAAFRANVDPDSSVHAAAYEGFILRLGHPGPVSRWALGPEACIPPLMHALQSSSPKHRYRVTTATKIAAVLKRLLPSTLLDKVAERGL